MEFAQLDTFQLNKVYSLNCSMEFFYQSEWRTPMLTQCNVNKYALLIEPLQHNLIPPGADIMLRVHYLTNPSVLDLDEEHFMALYVMDADTREVIE